MKLTCNYRNAFRILKGGKISLVVAALVTGSTIINASPSGGSVTSGTATIRQIGTVTNINQASQKTTINWQDFSIAKNETVNFIQPNANAIALNRVVGNEKSIINGALNANGQVWLLNSNGVLFNSTASINTAGLLATTKTLSDIDFNSGNYSFKGDSSASVINMGTINISDSGYAALLANSVFNQGTISALRGTVELTGAGEATINLNGNSMLNLKVTKGVLNALVENKGAILADGGQIYLTTNAVGELLKGVVNNTGVLEANSLDDVGGNIQLFAHGGTTNVSGSLSALGGSIETSGESLQVSEGTLIKAKDWLLDPTDITIESTGGTNLAGSSISANTIDNVLNGGTNVTLTATHDITVNEAMEWSQHLLTLSAGNTININSQMDLTNTAGLSLKYAQSTTSGTYNINDPINIATTGSFTTQHASDATLNYTIIDDVNNLQNINSNLSGLYVLGANIDASATSSWNTGRGFNPIGNYGTYFSGIFDGLGHTIDRLSINRTGSSDAYIGLFSIVSGTILNVGVTNGSINGAQSCTGALASENYGSIINSYSTSDVHAKDLVGGLVGYNYGAITNSYNTGWVIGDLNDVGGLVGANSNSGSITNSYSTGSVSGSSNSNYVGGLAGDNLGRISNSYSTGSVNANGSYNGNTGGLVGANDRLGTITNSYSTGSVSGNIGIGGLAGSNSGTISNSYNTGSVNANSSIGGLAGYNYGTITNSYNIGSVNGNSNIGGLVGYNTATITNSYSTGLVSGSSTVGGLLGSNTYSNGTISNSYWDIDTSGQSRGIGSNANYASIAGIQGSNGFNQAAYGGFDFTNTWFMIDGSTRPFLRSEYSTTLTNDHQLQLMAMNLGASYVLANNITYTGNMWNTAGFNPIGNNSTNFTGTFDGLGHTIDSITINRSGSDYIGLFGYSSGTIMNVGVTNESVDAKNYVGGLAGYNTGIITNSYTTGSLNGSNFVGGLAGYNTGTITNSYSSSSVGGSNYLGGLVGNNGGAIINSYSDGWVHCNIIIVLFVDGLAGFNSGTITNSYSGTIDAFNQATYSGFDFANTWVIYEGNTRPLLRSFMTPLTVTANDVSKTYDGITYAGGNGVAYSIATPDSSLLLGNLTYTSSGDMKNAGTATITPEGLYSSQQGYLINYVSGTSNIAKKALTITNATTADKVYDGDTTSTTTAGSLSGFIGTETVIANVVGTFSDKNAAAGKTVTDVYTLSDGTGLASNYSLANTTSTASITKADLSVTGLSAQDKIYDANMIATLNGTAAIRALGSDSVTLAGTVAGTFASKNIGLETITVSGLSLTGTDASNYTLIEPTSLSATITPKAITVTAVSNNKIYDATTAATAVLSSADIISGDTVTLGGTSTFADKNAAVGKTVTVDSLTKTGTDANNYTITNTTATTTASILKKVLTVGSTTEDKIYDGDTAATTIIRGLYGLVGSETLSASVVGTFADKNSIFYNLNNRVTNVYTLSDGTGLASNYSLANTTSIAFIYPKAITVTAVSNNKIYDASTAATAALSSADIISGDTVTLGGTATFDNKNAAVGKTVTVDALTKTGTDANNYTITNATATSTASITPKALTITNTTTEDKVYDGDTTSTTTVGTLSGLVGAETLSASVVGIFADKNAALSKTVTDVYTLADGTGLASNYSLANTTSMASIIPKALSITNATTADKVYDGDTTSTTRTGSLSGFIGTETVIANVVGTFSDKNAAAGKTITDVYTLSDGTGLASNYSLANTTSTASITKADLSVTGLSAQDKIYDANMIATLNGTAAIRALGSDSVTLAGTVAGTFASKNIGLETITVSGLSLTGTDASNYTLIEPTSLSATITPKAITVTAVSNNKIYDATTAATAVLSSADIISGDTVTLGGTSTFADKNAATGKTVTVATLTKTGTDANNYTITNTTATDVADITVKALTVTADSISKIYGIQDPLLTYTQTGLLSNDTLSGLLTRTAGKLAGNYVISQGTLMADSNYALSFIPGVFNIKPDIQKYITPITNNVSTGSQPSYTASANAFVADLAPQQTNASADKTVNTNIPIIEFGTNDVFTILNEGIHLPAGLTQDLLLVQNINAINNGDNN